MNIVIIGLSITSSWGNGHATTYRALSRGLAERGHEVLFLERDAPWYASHRDLPAPGYCRVVLYESNDELDTRHAEAIASADLVMVGSYVQDGPGALDIVLRRACGCTAFYDIDTPITLSALRGAGSAYIDRRHIPALDLYLSFTGGQALHALEHEFGARTARPLYCSVDPLLYGPAAVEQTRDLTYLGTYSEDRQEGLDRLLLEPARQWPEGRFAVAGAQFPATESFPANVEHIDHVEPSAHPAFYSSSRFTLNVTRRHMIDAGHSPSVRLFEAAACGTPIISDEWAGLADVFVPGQEILLARHTVDVLGYLRETREAERAVIGMRARARVLREHTSTHRARQLEQLVADARQRSGVARPAPIQMRVV